MQNRRLKKFRTWLQENEIGTTKGYEIVKTGRLKLVKLGRSSYVEESEGNRFISSLVDQAA